MIYLISTFFNGLDCYLDFFFSNFLVLEDMNLKILIQVCQTIMIMNQIWNLMIQNWLPQWEMVSFHVMLIVVKAN